MRSLIGRAIFQKVQLNSGAKQRQLCLNKELKSLLFAKSQ